MQNSLKSKRPSFMTNVSIILFAQIAVKLLGMVYSLVITNFKGFGDMGNGYRAAGFQIYTLLLAISSVGIPNAIAKMIAEKTAVNNYTAAHKIFKTALYLFAVIGFTASLLLFVFSGPISTYIIKMPGAKYTLMALSPSIFFVCVSSVIRGYFGGLQNMKATSSSQVLEQIFKCTLTIFIVYLLIGQSPEIMAAGANLATSLATVISFLYLIRFYKKRKPKFTDNSKSAAKTESKPFMFVVKSILLTSIPISLGSVITAINRIIDTATITRGIEIAFKDGFSTINGFISNPTTQQLTDEAVRLAGLLSKSDTLINMPLALNIAFATVLVPAISRALALGKKDEASDKVSYSLLISILLILPCAIGYVTLAQQIYMVLYPNAKLGFELLQLSSVALIFTALNQTMSGSLQGLGKIYTPATGLFFGCIVKIILNIVLIRQPSINIYGAAISSIVCQIVSFVICFAVLSKQLTLKISFVKYILKPLTAGIAMGTAAIFMYKGIFMLTASNLISLILTIAISAVIYFILVFSLKILSENEILALPAGNRILNLLRKMKIYKNI